MKQTAVEWLIDKLTESQFLWLSDKPEMNELIEIINQAKEMEKEQLKKVWMDAQTDQCKQFSSNYSGITFDEYLKIYKKEK
jgi:hypothetical protein